MKGRVTERVNKELCWGLRGRVSQSDNYVGEQMGERTERHVTTDPAAEVNPGDPAQRLCLYVAGRMGSTLGMAEVASPPS